VSEFMLHVLLLLFQLSTDTIFQFEDSEQPALKFIQYSRFLQQYRQ